MKVIGNYRHLENSKWLAKHTQGRHAKERAMHTSYTASSDNLYPLSPGPPQFRTLFHTCNVLLIFHRDLHFWKTIEWRIVAHFGFYIILFYTCNVLLVYHRDLLQNTITLLDWYILEEFGWEFGADHEMYQCSLSRNICYVLLDFI